MTEDSGFDLNDFVGTDSLSKGVFGFCGKKREINEDVNGVGKAKKKRKGAGAKLSKAAASKATGEDKTEDESMLKRLFEDGSDADESCLRYEAFKQTWSEATKIFKSVQEQNFAQIIDQVVEFVGQSTASSLSAEDFDLDHGSFGFGGDLILGEREIPTACILSGVNVPDHGDFFQQLKSSLLKNVTSQDGPVTSHVASVQSRHCASTLKSFMKVAVSQLVEHQNDEDTEEEEEEEEEDDKEAKNLVRKVSPRSLRQWYRNQHPPTTDGDHHQPPLVFILEDFEGFQTAFLHELIHNLKLLGLPVVLVIGVATTVDAVHRVLPHSITSHLAIRKFSSTPSVKLLAQLIQQLTLSQNIPFKLAGNALKTILETFMFHDFSVKHFMMAYKFCLMEHCMNTRASAMICGSRCRGDERASAIKAIAASEDLVNHLINLPSVGSFRGGKDTEEMVGFLKEEFEQSVQSFNSFCLFAKCLWLLSKDLPRQPLGKFFHSVYILAMLEPIQSTQEYRDVFKFLNLLEKTAISKQLQTIVECLQSSSPDDPDAQKTVATASNFITDLDNLDNLKKDAATDAKNSTPHSQASLKASWSSGGQNKSSVGGKMDRFKLQEALLEKAKEARLQSQTPFERLRSNIVDFYHQTFKRTLRPLRPWPRGSLRYSEAFLFDDVSSIRTRLQGTPRAAVQKALQAPHLYIDCPSLKIEDLNEIPATLPDVCIAYKLHLECGRYINLVDWFQCWLSIVKSEDGDGDDDKSDDVDPRLHARFNRAVSELQFLGFVRPSKRKTDHVERLTWNN